MLRALDELKGLAIAATDGEIGKVTDCYFDDEKWTIRYLVVDTGGWLRGRDVLISPYSVRAVEWHASRIAVGLKKAQVENSPPVEQHKPVSRQHEADFLTYYGYPFYWSGPYIWGPGPLPAEVMIPQPAGTQAREVEGEERQEHDVHLRSMREVTGYSIAAKDGGIGHVEKFIVDDDSWTIRYMVVDTRNWLPGKKVLVSPEWISEVSWSDKSVYVDLSRDSIRHCPEYDPYQPIERAYEERMYRHYGRGRYWVP
jgi:sporulation protein YlmC with PRC-barrel domain